MADLGWDDKCYFCDDGDETSKTDWVACDVCDKWCHNTCVGVSDNPNGQFSSWHCPDCEIEHGPSVLRRTSSRKRVAVDYAKLDRGEPLKPTHVFNDRFSTFDDYEHLPACPIPTAEQTGKEGVKQPIIVREDKYEQLDMRVPENLTVSRVVDLVGADTHVEVVDVQTQNGLVGWSLGSWRDYFEDERRTKMRNVISLEVSGTALGAAIRRPRFVRDMDLIDKVWASKEAQPKVQLYCLMSVAGSYTDFHIDFAGSSVFYHIGSGKKTFLFIPPTETNLNKYERWCNSIDQSERFFADEVKTCYRVDLDQGDSLVVPSGWIHAVHTPLDSVVIGGNFLTLVNLTTQIRLNELEKRTKVPPKFRFPKFDQLMEHTARYFADWHDKDRAPSEMEVQGVKSLRDYISNSKLVKELDVKLEKWGAVHETQGNGSSKGDSTNGEPKPKKRRQS